MNSGTSAAGSARLVLVGDDLFAVAMMFTVARSFYSHVVASKRLSLSLPQRPLPEPIQGDA